MAKKFFILIFLITVTIYAGLVFAQTSENQPANSSLPQPIQDTLDTAKKISVGVGDIPFFTRIAQKVRERDFRPENIFSGIKDIWNAVNDWLEANIGISLREIVQVIGNLILWILEFVIDLIKSGLGYVTNL